MPNIWEPYENTIFCYAEFLYFYGMITAYTITVCNFGYYIHQINNLNKKLINVCNNQPKCNFIIYSLGVSMFCIIFQLYSFGKFYVEFFMNLNISALIIVFLYLSFIIINIIIYLPYFVYMAHKSIIKRCLITENRKLEEVTDKMFNSKDKFLKNRIKDYTNQLSLIRLNFINIRKTHKFSDDVVETSLFTFHAFSYLCIMNSIYYVIVIVVFNWGQEDIALGIIVSNTCNVLNFYLQSFLADVLKKEVSMNLILTYNFYVILDRLRSLIP